MSGCGKKMDELNRHIVNHLSFLWTIQSKSILSRLSIPRSDISEIIRDAYVYDKVEEEMVYTSLSLKREPFHSRAAPDVPEPLTSEAQYLTRYNT